jgi:integrase
VSEADQRAAKGLGAGMPQRPAEVAEPDRIRAAPRFPYQVVAAAIARQITEGVLAVGDAAPPAVELAARHHVSLATAKRSLVLLTEWGLLERLGHDVLRVAAPSGGPVAEAALAALPSKNLPGAALLSLTVRRHGAAVAQFSTVADPTNASELHQVLAAAVVRAGGEAGQISEYEMDVHLPSESAALLTFVASPWTR